MNIDSLEEGDKIVIDELHPNDSYSSQKELIIGRVGLVSAVIKSRVIKKPTIVIYIPGNADRRIFTLHPGFKFHYVNPFPWEDEC